MERGAGTGSNMPWAHGGLNQRGYHPGVDELIDGRFYTWYMAVKEFYGEKIVDKHYHKGEQVYWDKFISIHNKWFKFSGLVPHTAGDFFLEWGVQWTGAMGWAGGRRVSGMG